MHVLYEEGILIYIYI